MKRILAALALLLVAGCDTYGSRPSQGPYGEPYPAPAPYPEPYPPQPGAYPPQPYQPAPQDCPITTSSGWTAWINAMPGPGGRPILIVTGKVTTATGGYQVAFDRVMQIRKAAPPQAFVTLEVAEPTGPASGAVVTHQVRWEWPLNQPIGSVVVRCGQETLAEITNIQTAY